MMRYGLPNFNMYQIVWGSSSATDNLAAPSVDPQFGRYGAATSSEDLDYFDDLIMNTSSHLGNKRVRASEIGQNKKSNGKGKVSYEDSITALANAYIAKQELDVTSKESRQYGHMSDGLFNQVVDIITVMVEFDFQQKVKAIEFFKLNQDTHNMLIKFSHVAYIHEVTNK